MFDSVSSSSQKMKDFDLKEKITEFKLEIDEGELETRGTFLSDLSGKKKKLNEFEVAGRRVSDNGKLFGF